MSELSLTRFAPGAALATFATAALLAAPASAREKRADTAPPPPQVVETARAFESARMLTGADRVAELDRLEHAGEDALRGDLSADRRAAIQALCAAIAAERGDYDGAEKGYRRAAETDSHSPFADDAAFAAIRALEGAGHDADAAREWLRWEKSHPSSSLIHEARLARAWNALRRGDEAEADRALSALGGGAPWMAGDPRVRLARATLLYKRGKYNDALTALSTGRETATAGTSARQPYRSAMNYLTGLCLSATGSRLRAAAAFQDVADRDPGSTLRDGALLAKANAFLEAHDDRSAAAEFARAATKIKDKSLRAEAELRAAGAVFLTGNADSSLTLLRGIAERESGNDVAARAQFLIGEVLVSQGKQSDAILEFNKVLTSYFRHSVAASAQYRVARCLDQLGRSADATGSYEAVVRGYPLEPEAPAAAYRAGLGMLGAGKPLAAAPYFQLVLDRYASRHDERGLVVFASPEHQELVEAALCLLEMSYHRAGDLGQLSGAPHLLLRSMPPSHSRWRSWALLIDADASAAQARFPEAQATLEALTRDDMSPSLGAAATKLLAWTYARQGHDSLAIATEERLLARYGASGGDELVAGTLLDIAHERFNQKRFPQAAAAYEDFLKRFPGDSRRMVALYQAGLCYLRLDRTGDAVDRWEAITRDSASSPMAERAFARAGDVYFQAEHFDDARRAYRGLLEHFANSTAASLAMLRLAQCEYNAGRDTMALARFAATIERFPGTGVAREAQRGTELALYRLSQNAGGEKQLALLIERYPSSAFAADAQFRLARRAYEQKRWIDAAEAFRRVVSQFPSYSAADHAQFLLSDAYAQAGRSSDAELGYEQFLSYFPQSELRTTVELRLGLIHFESKDYARAATAFMLALEDSASRDIASAARYDLALCERQLGQGDEARAELERYRATWPNDARAADVALQLGDLDEAAGHLDDARREFERALDSKPGVKLTTQIQFRLGRAREQLGDADGALRAYRVAAAAEDRDDPFRLSSVARCAALYEARHEYAPAIAAYRDLIRNARDRELVAAATDRASQLEAATRHR